MTIQFGNAKSAVSTTIAAVSPDPSGATNDKQTSSGKLSAPVSAQAVIGAIQNAGTLGQTLPVRSSPTPQDSNAVSPNDEEKATAQKSAFGVFLGWVFKAANLPPVLGPIIPVVMGMQDDCGGCTAQQNNSWETSPGGDVTIPPAQLPPVNSGELDQNNNWIDYGDGSVPITPRDLPPGPVDAGELDQNNNWSDFGDGSVPITPRDLPPTPSDQSGTSINYNDGTIPMDPVEGGPAYGGGGGTIDAPPVFDPAWDPTE